MDGVPRRLAIGPNTPLPTISELRLASVLDTAVDGIIIIDEQARILMANRACETLFGYGAADLLGRNIKMIMPLAEGGEHDGYVADYLSTSMRKIIGIDRDVKARHRDGTIFPVNVSIGEAVTPDGRQFIGILRDLRPRQEAEQRLSQLQADLLRMARVSAMDEMGAALAHELNQPLTALMLYLQAVERSCAKQAAGTALPQSALSILERAVREAERAGSIVQRMRQFVEKRDPVRRLLPLNPLVDDAIDLTLLGSRPGTRIIRALADDLPPLLVDPVQIQQVVVNLARNALEAVKGYDAADVHVATARADDKVVLSIQDNGPGIDPVAVPDLFRAFSSPKGTGMGLGLAISRTIAQNHGGDLVVEPGGNGRGACFKLQLPIPAATED